MSIHMYQYDIPQELAFTDSVAIDTETMGLDIKRDRLCLVQLSGGNGDAHLVQFPTPKYDAPNLKHLLLDKAITKLFHFARFDVAALASGLGISVLPIFCTKVASRLARPIALAMG